MKRTPFFEMHRAAAAKMIDFAGYEMPVHYPAGIVQEHLAVRNGAGVFDVSHMGEIEVRGTGAGPFLQTVTVNDVSVLKEGKAQYSAMTREDGGIIDDLLVYHMGDYFLLVVNASNIEKDFEWLRSHAGKDVDCENVSDRTALLAVQGPKSTAALQPLVPFDLSAIGYYRYRRGEVAGVPAVISRTGYTGETGYELYFDADTSSARRIWEAIFDRGKGLGIVPAGLGARDTLRLEMGFCLYGNDIDESTNPLEAGLGWITKIDKGEFIGRGALVEARSRGLERTLAGFTLPDKVPPRHGYALKEEGKVIGEVTSGTFSPSLQRGIGMGYIRKQSAIPGRTIGVDVRGKDIPATVVSLPFIRKSSG